MKKMEFIVSSFDWNALKEVSLANSAIPIGVLTKLI
jgi:glycerophosphoryl diester phosphodiesterase